VTDYHTKPLLTARVPRESLDWARGEAERRGQPFGDFVDGLIAAERDRVNYADYCPHPPARVHKGMCHACGTYTGTGDQP